MYLLVSNNLNTVEMDKLEYDVFLNTSKKTKLFTGMLAKYYELETEYFSLHHVGGITAIPFTTLQANYHEIVSALMEYLKVNKLEYLTDVINKHTLRNVDFSISNKEVDITNNLITVK